MRGATLVATRQPHFRCRFPCVSRLRIVHCTAFAGSGLTVSDKMPIFMEKNDEKMKKTGLFLCLLLCGQGVVSAQESWPDGTPVEAWFSDTARAASESLGTPYEVTEYGVVRDSTRVQTEALQRVIDRAAAEGGGVIVIPKGVYLSGALFFPQGVHLHIEREGVLKGSDNIADFPIVDTRIEGQSLRYFAALVNADHADGFTITGPGTVNGNGERYWRSFWLRREVNPRCTNMDELRPRLIYISNSKNVRIENVTLKNSPFWTTHLYRCSYVRMLDVRTLAPAAPVKAPSSDALDLDACENVHVCGCYISVNDDAIALKGGKGPWADEAPENGPNRNILVENCIFGFCHSALTCGSECIHSRNVILHRCTVSGANRLLWLKMRPDTPQRYEYILVEEVDGEVLSMLYIHPWTQFFDLKGRKDIPLSRASHVTLRNIGRFRCDTFFDVAFDDTQYRLADFTFENLRVKAKNTECDRRCVAGFGWRNVELIPVEGEACAVPLE